MSEPWGPGTAQSDEAFAGVETAPSCAAAHLTERAALGRALRASEPEILQRCQKKVVDQIREVDPAQIIANPLWEITSLAVFAVADWLETGTTVGSDDQDRITSIGNAAAQGKYHSVKTGDVTPVFAEGSREAMAKALSITLVTQLNLWWSGITCHVLTEQVRQLGLSRRTLDEARRVVVQSANAALVSTARRYDEEIGELHAQLAHLASHDPLTGLANRSTLVARLDQAIARLALHPGGVAAVFIDLDNFKVINDVFGHACGDQVLTTIAGRLSSQIRSVDSVARFGGDEFVALFEDLTGSTDEVTELAERLHQVVAQPIIIGREELRLTASIGVAVVRRADIRPDQVLTRADETMYAVKRAGRDRVKVVDMEAGDQAPARFAVASGLHCALERQELRLAYQPIFGLEKQELVGFEALLRWNHPERGLIPPLDFIPVAEESGLMVAIGGWVIEEACRQAVSWASLLGELPRMAVNVSGRQLADATFPQFVAKVLEGTGMPASSLVLEITESILLGENEHYESVLGMLKQIGVRLSIDDFGTGYSSLAYLRRFPVDQLKVDRAFIEDVAEHGDTRIMAAVVTLAHDLGLEVVAEGVETETQLTTVRSLGCDVVQGFFLGRPVPSSSIGTCIEGHHDRARLTGVRSAQ